MALEFKTRPPVPSDVDAIMADLRPADFDEVSAASGPDVRASIYRAVCVSSRAFCGVINGKPAGLFGVAPYAALAGIGSPWLVGTRACDNAPYIVCRYSRALLKITEQEYPHLINYVDVRHVKSIKWLKWLGFTLHDPAPYGQYGMPFHKFELRR